MGSLDRARLQTLTAVGRGEMHAMGYRPDTCISAAALAIDVAAAWGSRGRAVDCGVMVFNRPAAALVQRGILYRDDADAWDQAGAWSVGIGYGAPPNAGPRHYDGHVIAIIEERWLLDLSLDQIQRPEFNLALHPVMTVATPAFLQGQPLQITVAGASVLYRLRQDRRGWRASTQWKNLPARHALRDRVLQAIRAGEA